MSLIGRALGVQMGAGAKQNTGDHPAPNLQMYAQQHGLAFEGARAVPGVHTGMNVWDEGACENMMSGTLPGGEPGAIGHERVLSGHSSKTNRNRHAAHTTIAVRVPEAVGPLQRFALTNAQREDFLRSNVLESDPEVSADELGFGGGPDWRMTLAPGADRELTAGLLGGAFGSQVKALPDRFGLVLRHGSLVLDCTDGFLEGAALDARCHALCALTGELRSAALAAAEPADFDAALPAPPWLGEPAVDQRPKVRKKWGITIQTGTDPGPGAIREDATGLDAALVEPWRSVATTFAEQGGAEIEDALAFHRAFPSLPLPGNAFIVLRAVSPEAGTTRIVFSTEGVIAQGPAAVVFRVKASAPERPAPVGGARDAWRMAIADGLAVAWVHRSQDFNVSRIPEIAEQAWKHATAEGWV